MLIVVSPAKTLDFSNINNNLPMSKPKLINYSLPIMKTLREYDTYGLERLMKVSNKLALLNKERIEKWNDKLDNSNHALLSYTGEVFRGIDAMSFRDSELFYADNHLRILSGLYGVLRPLDGINEYRLEMCTKLKIENKNNLYKYWDNIILNEIKDELNKHDNKLLINLASQEYFKAIEKIKEETNVKVITPIFMEAKLDGYRIVTMKAKKARGLMVRYIIENRIEDIEGIKHFSIEDYRYNEELSNEENIVFTRD